uniref:Uncharacterized protein n=1 Tax=Salvator merianae TaxID=96440 RepID=A0A8D0BDH4_SALMN
TAGDSPQPFKISAKESLASISMIYHQETLWRLLASSLPLEQATAPFSSPRPVQCHAHEDMTFYHEIVPPSGPVSSVDDTFLGGWSLHCLEHCCASHLTLSSDSMPPPRDNKVYGPI